MKPTRKTRKIEKLKARGTYRPANQWSLDKAHAGVVYAAERFASHLGVTAEELLARYDKQR